MQFVDIVGSGAWGTTLAMLIAQKQDASVRIVARREEIASSIRQRHRNDANLFGIPLPEKITAATLDSASFEKTTHIILATPAQHLRTTLRHRIFSGLGRSALIMHAIKGIEHYTPDGSLSGKRMSEVIFEELKRNASVLSGPNLAREIAQGHHACSVVASSDLNEAASWKGLLNIPERFVIEISGDAAGVEIAGSLKNIVAIGVGLKDGVNIRNGLRESDNEKAEIAVKALKELIAYGTAKGADKNTFYGIAGIGDIMATCFSKESRNRFVGEEIGKGRLLRGVLDDLKKSKRGEPEGPETVKLIYEQSRQLNIRMPLTGACYNVLFNKKDPEKEIKEFLKG